VIKNEKVALDRLQVRQNVFLVKEEGGDDREVVTAEIERVLRGG